jgi:hypothetical protein
MFKVKQLGVAAATMIFAGAAMASNFRAADQVYVPAAGHAQGAAATFISDVYASNLSDDSVDVSVIYATGVAGTQQTFKNAFTLLPRERREMNDFMVNTLHIAGNSLGQLVFNACKAGQDCTPDPSTGLNANYRNISVESRIYSVPSSATNPSTAPSNGQLFSGIPWYNYVSEASSAAGLDKIFITGIRATSNFRTNMGFVNASQFSATTLVATLFDGSTGNQIAQQSISLQPFGWTQLTVGSSLFNGFSGTNAWVRVEQTNTLKTSDADANGCPTGCPAFLAYGSQLDAQTQDATTLESQYFQSLTNNAITCIYSPDVAGCSSKAGQGPRRAVKH